MSKTLAIETSCDDTSLAIVRYEQGQFFVDQLQAYSQIADHQAYGGVVPEIAFRLHSEQILALLQHFSEEIKTEVDVVSVTTHPGLAGSLLVGKTVAQTLGLHYQKPVIGVHHIFGHIFSLLLERSVEELPFPWVVLTASGGHNEIYVITQEGKNPTASGETIYASDNPNVPGDNGQNGPLDHSAQRAETLSNAGQIGGGDIIQLNTSILGTLSIKKLGKTLDDAAGECFDKVARMLGGPYPGGARIGEQAALGKPNSQYRFKRILLEDHDNPYDFSFSGMKSQVYNLLQKCEREGIVVAGQLLYDVAYEFQEAVVDILVQKLTQAVGEYHAQTVGVVGGVSANDRLFEQVTQSIQNNFGKPVYRPAKKVYSTDNGAMIGVVGLLMNN